MQLTQYWNTSIKLPTPTIPPHPPPNKRTRTSDAPGTTPIDTQRNPGRPRGKGPPTGNTDLFHYQVASACARWAHNPPGTAQPHHRPAHRHHIQPRGIRTRIQPNKHQLAPPLRSRHTGRKPATAQNRPQVPHTHHQKVPPSSPRRRRP